MGDPGQAPTPQARTARGVPQGTAGMGRKTSANPRLYRRTLRFTADEILAVEQAAAAAGMTFSDYVRQAATRGKGQHHPQARATRRAHDAGLELQARRLGTNLNQIAHRLNAQNLPAPPELAPLLADIRALINEAGAPDETAADRKRRRSKEAAHDDVQSRRPGDGSEAHPQPRPAE